MIPRRITMPDATAAHVGRYGASLKVDSFSFKVLLADIRVKRFVSSLSSPSRPTEEVSPEPASPTAPRPTVPGGVVVRGGRPGPTKKSSVSASKELV